MSSIDRRSCGVIKEEKIPLSNEVVCFEMLIVFDTSKSKSNVSKSKSWKITSFSKSMSVQKDLFLTMFYTTNLSS